MFLSPSDLVHRLPLKKGDKACDFGCGSGAYLSSLSNMVGNTGKVFAFDIHHSLIERLQREAEKYGYDNVEFAICDIEKKTYLEDYSLDAAILSNILFQVENPDAVIKEVKRILKPNGFLLVVDWKKSKQEIKFGPDEKHFMLEEKILAILAKNDFTIKKHLPAGEFHYALIAEI